MSRLPDHARSDINWVLGLNFLSDVSLYGAVWSLLLLEQGFSVTQLSVYLTLSYLAQTLCELPSGLISDRLGARWTLSLGQVIFLLGLAAFALAPNFFTLILMAIGSGVSAALYSDTDTTLVYRQLRAAGRTHDYPRFLAVYNGIGFLGSGVGALVGALLANHVSLMATVWATLPVALLHLLLVQHLREPAGGQPDSTHPTLSPQLLRSSCGRVVRDASLRATVLFAALSYTLNMIVWSYYQNYAELMNVPLLYYGALAVIFSVAESLPQFFAHYFLAHPRLQRVYAAITALTAGCLLIAAVRIDAVGLLFLVLAVVITGFSFPITDTALRRGCQVQAWTTVASLKTFAEIFGFALGNILFGLLADTHSLSLAFGGIGVLALLLTASLLIGQQRQPITTASAPSPLAR